MSTIWQCYIERGTCILQVTANNISVVRLSGLDAPSSQSDPLLPKGGHRQLSALCNALQACLSCPLPQDLILALLLSAVTAGVPAIPSSQANDTAARSQVNFLKCFLPPCCKCLLVCGSCDASVAVHHSPCFAKLSPASMCKHKLAAGWWHLLCSYINPA